jgi:hypothetical protein
MLRATQQRQMQHTAPNKRKRATTDFVVNRKQVTEQGQKIPMCHGWQRPDSSDRSTPRRAQFFDIILVKYLQFTPEEAHTIRIE